MITEGVSDILQTIYHEGRELNVVTMEEGSGKVRLDAWEWQRIRKN